MIARSETPRFDFDRIMQHVNRKDGDCWVWEGSKYSNGYGKYGKAGYMAHRLVYELLVGKIPAGMFLDHLCHDRECRKGMQCEHRLCVNPAHLEIVTKGENVLRGNSVWADNARKTHCKRGHKFTDKDNFNKGTKVYRRCSKCHADTERERQRNHRKT